MSDDGQLQQTDSVNVEPTVDDDRSTIAAVRPTNEGLVVKSAATSMLDQLPTACDVIGYVGMDLQFESIHR